MAKIKAMNNKYWFLCPGCRTNHGFDLRWKFNHDFDNPTVTPRIKSWSITKINGEEFRFMCHVGITDGHLYYDESCTHPLKGQYMPMPDWDEEKVTIAEAKPRGGDDHGQEEADGQGREEVLNTDPPQAPAPEKIRPEEI